LPFWTEIAFVEIAIAVVIQKVARLWHWLPWGTVIQGTRQTFPATPTFAADRTDPFIDSTVAVLIQNEITHLLGAGIYVVAFRITIARRVRVSRIRYAAHHRVLAQALFVGVEAVPIGIREK
jgi:hypothetical protein